MYREKIITMLMFLLIKCNEECPEHIAELFFIDDIEVPVEISSIIKARILQTRYIKYIFFPNIKYLNSLLY